MRKWILIIVSQLVFYFWAPAQDQVGCNQILEDAREAYSAGMVDVVPALLNDCLKSGLTGTSKQEAYILVISSYLFDYLPDKADTMMEEFLDAFPDYLSKTSDPEEFTMLLNTHKQKREEARKEAERLEKIAEQNRLEEQARQEARRQQELKAQRKNQRNQAGSGLRPGLGFLVGTNLTLPQILEVYGISDLSTMDAKFGPVSPGLHGGATGILPISNSIEVSLGLLYQRIKFSYSATPFSFTDYTYSEAQDRFALPVSFLFHLNPGSATKVYLEAGAMAETLTKATASAERRILSGGFMVPAVVVDETDISTSRTKLNIYGTAGAGIRFQVGAGFIFLEAGYRYGFMTVNEPSKRYANQDFLWQAYHVDPDFRLQQVYFSAGMVFYLK